MKRYDQLATLIRESRPAFIVEIGVHEGIRGAAMMREALRYRGIVTYRGYDVFDTKGERFHEKAYNKKGIVSQEAAEKTMIEAGLSPFSFEYIVGNTVKTLHGGSLVADFVFIDGDHRASVIRGDYEAVRGSKLIVFDDYYTDGPDIEKIGCNQIVDALVHELMPIKDPIKGGGLTQLAVVRNT